MRKGVTRGEGSAAIGKEGGEEEDQGNGEQEIEVAELLGGERRGGLEEEKENEDGDGSSNSQY